jgi:hypothetical protein
LEQLPLSQRQLPINGQLLPLLLLLLLWILL